jgi:hypothetical protein
VLFFCLILVLQGFSKTMMRLCQSNVTFKELHQSVLRMESSGQVLFIRNRICELNVRDKVSWNVVCILSLLTY